jgi:hypothetical protein
MERRRAFANAAEFAHAARGAHAHALAANETQGHLFGNPQPRGGARKPHPNRVEGFKSFGRI